MRDLRGAGAAAALLPVLTILTLLFGGGLGFAIVQSIGYFAPSAERSFTLSHYASLLSDSELQASIFVTFLWSTIATLLSMILGVTTALALRHVARNNGALTMLLQVPVAFPHLAMAVLALNVLGQSGLVARMAFGVGFIDAPAAFPEIFHDRYGAGIVLTYVLKEAPFIALIALAMLRRSGTEYESLAATLGAAGWQRFRYVTLPLIAPPVISGSLIVFAFVFGSFEIPFLLGRPYPAMLGILVQRRFLSNDLSDRPGAIAAGVLMSAISAVLVMAYLRLSKRLLGERPTLF